MNISFLNIKSEDKSIWDTVDPQNYGVLLLSQILRDEGHKVSIHNNKTIKGKLE